MRHSCLAHEVTERASDASTHIARLERTGSEGALFIAESAIVRSAVSGLRVDTLALLRSVGGLLQPRGAPAE
eukprot:14255784-Alexandrium_andersonii.AAC.1